MRSKGFSILVLLALAAAAAVAAPLGAPPTPATSTGDESEPLVVPSAMDAPAAKVPGSNRTMDLLLEMQAKEPAVPAPTDTARAPRSAALARSPNASNTTAGANPMLADGPAAQGGQPARAATPGAPGPALFGSDTAPAPITATAPSNAEWQATQRSSGGHRPRGEAQPQRWVLIPAELVAWLRENRNWVIGSAVLSLALMWGVTTVFSRRRA